MTIDKTGQLIDYVKEAALNHNATPHTPIYVRDGADGPLKRISQVKMMEDVRGLAIIIETSAVLIS